MAKKRKAGDGTLRLRKDGRWEGRVVVGYGEDGRPVTKNVTAKSKTECQKKLEDLKTECGIVTGKARPGMPFGEWIDLWFRTWSAPTLRVTTQSSYRQRIYNHIIPAIGAIPLNKLKKSDLQIFYADLKKNGRLIRTEIYGPGLSDRMVRSCHATCRSALQKAVEEGLISSNPAIGCRLPPKKTAEMKVLTHEEMRRFLIQAKEDNFYAIAVTELATGMRRGELCALRWEDLNFRTGELHVCRQAIYIDGKTQISAPKTKSGDRMLILPPAVLNVLREQKENTDSEWIFPSPVSEGMPCNPQSIYGKMKKVLKRAQCKNVRFHDLRHTFATTALEHGMDIKTLSMIIGHVSSATTVDIYSHITTGMQRAAAEKIGRSFGGSEAFREEEKPAEEIPGEQQKTAETAPFQPYKGKIRKSGTGGIYEINDHLFEGRYTPTNAYGKRESHNVYAKTREECETLLAKMIEEVKAQISEDKARLKAEASGSGSAPG